MSHTFNLNLQNQLTQDEEIYKRAKSAHTKNHEKSNVIQLARLLVQNTLSCLNYKKKILIKKISYRHLVLLTLFKK